MNENEEAKSYVLSILMAMNDIDRRLQMYGFDDIDIYVILSILRSKKREMLMKELGVLGMNNLDAAAYILDKEIGNFFIVVDEDDLELLPFDDDNDVDGDEE